MTGCGHTQRAYGRRATMWCVVGVLLLWPGHRVLAQAAGAGQSVEAGARVFGSKGCVKCHAVNGRGGTEGPDFGMGQRQESFYGFAAAMWNHLPSMGERMRELDVDPPRLRAQEIGDLVAFLSAVNYFHTPGDTQVGRRLFADKGCILCHQIGGVGGVVGPDLDYLRRGQSPIRIAAAMWNHGGAMIEALRARGIARPSFTGTELTDLLAYLASSSTGPRQQASYVLPGRADVGRALFTEKRCIECHPVRGLGGTVGPDLAQRAQSKSLVEFAAAMWNKMPEMVQAMEASGISAPSLEPGEMADIVGYLHAVQYFAEAGDPRQGQAVARNAGCLSCHSLYGRGGTTAIDLNRARGLNSATAVLAALWNHITIPDISGSGTVPWRAVSSRDLANLMAFLQTITATR